MVESEEDVRGLLQGTPMARSRICSVTVPETHEAVFAIEVEESTFAAWQHWRALVPRTGRWPVLMALHSRREDAWVDQVRDFNPFGRFPFQHELGRNRSGDDPDAIVAASRRFDLATALADMAIGWSEGPEEDLGFLLDETVQQFGVRPDIPDPLAFLADNRLYSQDAVERWLFEWEIANCPDALALHEHGLAHLRWFEPKGDSQALLLMPSANGWETLAYHAFYGAGESSSEFLVALLRDWHERFGAELVAHYGTMLHFVVARRPGTPREAMQLALEQAVVAGDTIFKPGVSIRDHARALLHADRWFLHNRP